jgi:hypothetical protein
MCVILQCDSKMPKSSMLKDAEQTNPHGGGFAYTKNGLVHWEKGLHVTAKYIEKYIKRNKLTKANNLIVHFRIKTHGDTNDMLCHPFPVGLNKDGSALRNRVIGSTTKAVMFHNGIWSEYDDMAIKLAFNSPTIRIPDGDMSDSSIMAWCASHKGINFLEFTDEKVIVLSPEGITRFGDGWTTVDHVKCSNDLFEKTTNWFGGTLNDGYGYTPINYHREDNVIKTDKVDDDSMDNIECADFNAAYDMDYSTEEFLAMKTNCKEFSYPDTNGFYCDNELGYYDGKVTKYSRKEEEPQ